MIDENGNIYVINNDTIELRNTKAELISKSKTYKRINGGLINDKMLYVSSIENNKLYLVILNEKLEEQSKVLISNLRGSEYYPEIEYRDGKITISIFDNESLVFAYDIKTKSVNEVKSTD